MEQIEKNEINMAEAFYNEHQLQIYCQTDRMFVWLFVAEWIVSIGIAIILSPKTWIGTQSEMHIHLWVALILELIIISLPIYLIKTNPGKAITRHAVAISQMLISALLIHLTGGRIETHFHVFASLALLASYRDTPVLVSATIVVALDHLLRGIFWPESAFGVLITSYFRWVEHAWWVVFEDFFLIRNIVISQNEMRDISRKNAKLLLTNEYINRQIAEKVIEIEQKNNELLHVQKMISIGHLAAGVAHEINTPIQYVGDNIYFLKNFFDEIINFLPALSAMNNVPDDLDYLKQEIPKAIAQSQEGIGHVSKIVKALKDFSHPGTTEKSLVDLNRAIETVVTVARNEWKYNSDLELKLDPNLPLIMCLPNEINQVLLNLVVNATQAIQQKNKNDSDAHGYITIETVKTENGVKILVRDSGTGIAPEIQSKIFDPFFTTKDVGQGTGQGLALTYTIITDQHQGKISFETTVGVGTTFIIDLPFGEESTTAVAANE